MSSSIHSVNSNITSNTFNTCNTGDGTVQASNAQRKKIYKYRCATPPIEEESSIYDLSGSSDVCIKELSSSEPTTVIIPSKSREIKYDLSGTQSSEDLRKGLRDNLIQIDCEARQDEKGEQEGTGAKKDDSWLGFLFCYNNDTTNDAATLATDAAGSDSSQSGRQSPASDRPIDSNEESKSNPVERLRSSTGSTNSTPVTDAALLARAKKDLSVLKSRKKKVSKINVDRLNQSHGPPSPTKLDAGAGSLDIVMELRLDEDLLIGKKKNGPKKKGKITKRSSSMNKDKGFDNNVETNSSAGDIQSVMSERSLFSFATANDPKEGKLTSRNGAGMSAGMGKAVCITGPVNGTFQNVTSAKDAENSEIANTYNQFRVFARSVDMVLNRIGTTVPLYHWTGSQSFRFGTISMSGSGDDLGLSSFSNLDLGSSSMRSTAEGDIPINLMNVCSEPSSKMFDVRGASYLTNGKKTPSGETMFSLLGVDSIMKSKSGKDYVAQDVCKASNSYLSRLTAASKCLGLKAPFLIVVNFVVPWGNLISYFYRPDATKGGPFCDTRKNHSSEKLWKSFLNGSTEFRNNYLKFIPRIIEGPWALKKLVGSNPVMIGQKIPTSYYGSVDNGYIEICIDVTKGGKMANSICSAVASKASSVTIDLAFLLQGTKKEELPEQLLSVVRLHHVKLKKKNGLIEI